LRGDREVLFEEVMTIVICPGAEAKRCECWIENRQRPAWHRLPASRRSDTCSTIARISVASSMQRTLSLPFTRRDSNQKLQGKLSQFNWVLIQPIPEPLAIQKTSQIRRVSCTITEVWVEREFNKRGIGTDKYSRNTLTGVAQVRSLRRE
jgi:hypothetical protein